MMKQEDYLTGIKKQQALVRKLFASRKRRSECIDELTKQRYGHLIGKFFKAPKDDERFRGVEEGTTLYICDIFTDSNYTNSDDVNIEIVVRFFSPSYNIDDKKQIISGLEYYATAFRFAVTDNLDDILAPLYITQEKAAEEVSAMYDEFIKNFLKKG